MSPVAAGWGTQNIEADFSKYNMFLAICQERSNGDTISAIAFKGKQCRDWFWSGTGDNNAVLSEYRIFTIQDTSMTISYAVLLMSSGWSANERTDRLLPYRIYGIT